LAKIDHCQFKSPKLVCLGYLTMFFLSFHYILLCFPDITYVKNVSFPSGIHLTDMKQKKCFVSLNNETNKAF